MLVDDLAHDVEPEPGRPRTTRAPLDEIEISPDIVDLLPRIVGLVIAALVGTWLGCFLAHLVDDAFEVPPIVAQ